MEPPAAESPNSIFQIGVVEVPYPMEGAGWLDVTLKNKEGFFTVILSDGSNDIIFSGQGAFLVNETMRPLFYAYTGGASNQHGVRNIQLEILESSSCPAPAKLDFSEAVTQIEAVCGSMSLCPSDPESYQACFDGEVLLLSSNNLLLDQLEELLGQALRENLSYCEGYSKCYDDIDFDSIRAEEFQRGYDQGFADGVESVDTDAIRQEGFDAGVSSIDIEAIKQQAYDEGFKAGQESVCPANWRRTRSGECKKTRRWSWFSWWR